MIYLTFTLVLMLTMNVYDINLLTGWVLVVNGIMLLLCLGLAERYFFRWQVRVTSVLGFKNIGYWRYV